MGLGLSSVCYSAGPQGAWCLVQTTRRCNKNVKRRAPPSEVRAVLAFKHRS